MQPLDPLAVEAIGLGPALDLAGECRRGHDHREAGFHQREEQHVSVDAAGFHRHGGHTALSQPGDQVAESGGVGGELADGFGAVGGGADAHPVAGVANVDAGGVRMLDGHRSEPGHLLGLTADPLGVGFGGRTRFTLASGHGGLQNGEMGGDVRHNGGVGTGTSRSNGINRGPPRGRVGGCHQPAGRKRSPAQSNHRAERKARRTRNETGHGVGRRDRIAYARPKFPAPWASPRLADP